MAAIRRKSAERPASDGPYVQPAVTRRPSFRFEAGQFAMIGLQLDGRPLMRAYSMTSAPFDDHLSFSASRSRMALLRRAAASPRRRHAASGARRPAPCRREPVTWTQPGFAGHGDGFAPFASIIRNTETYARIERVIVVHGAARSANSIRVPMSSTNCKTTSSWANWRRNICRIT